MGEQLHKNVHNLKNFMESYIYLLIVGCSSFMYTLGLNSSTLFDVQRTNYVNVKTNQLSFIRITALIFDLYATFAFSV